MLPNVTLCGQEESFSLQFGTASYTFHLGKKMEVPVAVALSLRGRKNEKGKPLFLVKGLPLIIPSKR